MYATYTCSKYIVRKWSTIKSSFYHTWCKTGLHNLETNITEWSMGLLNLFFAFDTEDALTVVFHTYIWEETEKN